MTAERLEHLAPYLPDVPSPCTGLPSWEDIVLQMQLTNIPFSEELTEFFREILTEDEYTTFSEEHANSKKLKLKMYYLQD